MNSLDKWRRQNRELLRIFKKTRDLPDFLEDIFTPGELADIIDRWEIIKCLEQKMSQRAIAKKLHVSLAKVTHGARILSESKQGFKQVLINKLYVK